MFDLNKPPTLVEGEVSPRDSGTEKKPQIQAHSATSAAPKTFASSSRNYTFDPSDLAHLLLMVKDLPNDLPASPNLVLVNTNHARLPPYTSAFSNAPATAWIGSSSSVPQHLTHLATTAAGDGAPAVREVIVMPFEHGRVVEVWSRNGAGGGLSGNQNAASQCQTTMDVDGHVVSDGESDSYRPRNPRNNSNSKAPLVDLDILPDEIPVEPLYPWSPGHQEEAPFHSTIFRMSSENLQGSATTLPPMSLEEELRLREVAFNACFKLETQRCTPTARCRSCLAFCQMRLPKLRLPSLQEGSGPGGGLQSGDECPPVLRNVEDDEGRQARKMSRHGPKSKSSEYRGVTFYKRTGRWEAHIWHEGAQVYLGASRTKEEAARAYDQAALLLFGPEVDINFLPESYKMEMAYLYKLSKEQLVIYLRRDSRGFGAQVPYPGVKHVKNLYQASYGRKLMGTFTIEEDAARAVYKEALRNSFGGLANLILDAHHVRNMPSFAAQRFAALYPGRVDVTIEIPVTLQKLPGVVVSEPDHSLVSPELTSSSIIQNEAVERMQQGNQAKPIASKRPSVPERTSTPQTKKRLTRPERIPIQDFTFPPAVSSAIAATHPGAVEQLPGNKINETIQMSPGALPSDRTWGANQSRRTRHRHASDINPIAPQHLESRPHQPSNGINTLTPQQLRKLLPKLVRPLAAPTAASSSCHAPSAPSSIPRATGEASSSGVIKFKLFNVEISVEEVQDHGSN